MDSVRLLKAFYKNGDSYVIVQLLLWRHFNIHRNNAVQSAHAINICVDINTTSFALKKKPMPKNIASIAT